MFGSGDVWLQLTILLGIAVASHFIVTKFGQPMVIVEIAIGILLGPSILALIYNTDLITLFAQFGAVFLLFAIGLECDLKEIYTRKSLVIATCGVIIPWISGFLFGMAVGQSFGTSVFIGAILVATSVAVTAEILIELKLLNKSVGKTIIGAAVVDDILGMIVLALSVGVSQNSFSLSNLSSMLPIFLIVIAASLFIIVGGYLGSRYLGRVICYVEEKTKKVEHSGFLFAIAVMFLYVFIAEQIGISAIIGAFVAGTMFSSVAVKREFDVNIKLLIAIFAPIFFVSIGLMVDLRGVTGVAVILLGFVLAVVAILTKVIGCGAPAKAMGMSTKESLVIGIGMSPRCEVALVIALLGLSAGIIGQDIYVMAVMVALMTTVVTPPLLRALFKKKHTGIQRMSTGNART